jgi:hypothetical protein
MNTEFAKTLIGLRKNRGSLNPRESYLLTMMEALDGGLMIFLISQTWVLLCWSFTKS